MKQNNIGPAVLFALIVLLIMCLPVFAQHSGHPPQDQEIHERFYSTWMMPEARWVSCCNMKDCYPTAARQVDGHWQAQRREDGEWLDVPDEKVELERDNPDGRSHLCAPAPALGRRKIFCFIAGLGI